MSLVGHFVESFRNKKFVFLKNIKFTNYGNISFVH